MIDPSPRDLLHIVASHEQAFEPALNHDSIVNIATYVDSAPIGVRHFVLALTYRHASELCGVDFAAGALARLIHIRPTDTVKAKA